MLTITDIQVYLQTVTNKKVTYTDIGNVLGTGKANISLRAKNNSKVTEKEIQLLERAYNVDIKQKSPKEQALAKIKELQEQMGLYTAPENVINVTYRPDVSLSAGYGITVYEEKADTISLDARLFVSDKGNKIDSQYCEVVKISGNSMYPEYRDGDRVIIDRNCTELIDGHIFAFRYNEQCFVKEINLLGKRIKCISLNKEYDPFYIEEGEPLTVLGRILPRIRL